MSFRSLGKEKKQPNNNQQNQSPKAHYTFLPNKHFYL